jgi:hypothetical protein
MSNKDSLLKMQEDLQAHRLRRRGQPALPTVSDDNDTAAVVSSPASSDDGEEDNDFTVESLGFPLPPVTTSPADPETQRDPDTEFVIVREDGEGSAVCSTALVVVLFVVIFVAFIVSRF